MSSPTAPSVSAHIPPPGHYTFDPSQSTVTFTTRHMFGLGSVTGSFDLREGELTVGKTPSATTMRAVIDAASFTTGNTRRNEHVRSPQLLDAARHPDITYEADRVHERRDGWVAVGRLTVRGATNHLEVTLHETVEADGALTLVGKVHLDRYAHGVTAVKGMAGRWLDLTITAVTSAP